MPVNQHVQQWDVSSACPVFRGNVPRTGNWQTEGQEVFSFNNFGVEDRNRMRREHHALNIVSLQKLEDEHPNFFKMHQILNISSI